jgi:hypothetical protein
LRIDYPGSIDIQYGYMGGYLDSIVREDTNEKIIEGLEYAPHGGHSTIRFGNGVMTTHLYDPLYNYRLHSKRTFKSGSQGRAYQDVSYTFDMGGNILTLDDV